MADQGDKKRPAPGAEIDPDAPPSAEEIAASQRLRDALEDPSLPSEDADLARALAAAYAPSPLAEDDLDAIVLASLSPEEALAAEGLRRALEGDAAAGGDHAALARALAAAWSPRPLSDEEHRRIVDAALGAAPRRGEVVVLRRRSAVVRVAFGAAGVLALAASVALVVREAARGDGGGPEAPLARARSTQPLFSEPFKPGDASARIDRIAMARASDYRDNRFAKWGVR